MSVVAGLNNASRDFRDGSSAPLASRKRAKAEAVPVTERPEYLGGGFNLRA